MASIASPVRKCLISVCLDRSGSMDDVCASTIRGVNEFITSQAPALNDNMPTKLGVLTFSTSIKWLTSGSSGSTFIPIEDFGEITDTNYRCGGSTALHDAISETIYRCDEYCHDNPDTMVIIVVQTDGYDNCSKFSLKVLIDLIAQRCELGWEFVFMGADQDACLNATQLGMSPDRALNYTATNIGTLNVMSTLSRNVSSYRSPNVSLPS